MKNRISIAIRVVACILGLSAGCRESEKDSVIKLVIPSKYRGMISVIADPNFPNPGVLPYELQISAQGIGIVKSLEMFDQWHRLRAYLADGTELPLLNTEGDQNTLGIYMLGSNATNQSVEFFVGRLADLRKRQSPKRSEE